MPAWLGLTAHRPVGSIMRARKAAYAMGAQFSQEHNKQPICSRSEKPRSCGYGPAFRFSLKDSQAELSVFPDLATMRTSPGTMTDTLPHRDRMPSRQVPPKDTTSPYQTE
jgi:hypothetical protein